MFLILVASIASDGGCGYEGQVPWRIGDGLDLVGERTFFEGIITDECLIMGRRAASSAGMRKDIEAAGTVITLSEHSRDTPTGDYHATSFDQAKSIASMYGYRYAFVVGGVDTYERAIAERACEAALINYVMDEYPADVKFPSFEFSRAFEHAELYHRGDQFLSMRYRAVK